MAEISESIRGIEYGLRELQRKSYEVSFDLSGTDYVASRNIGSGTYGIVCSAVNKRTGENVAIKKIINIFENVILARRTYREMKILQHFRHDNIIRIREILAPSDRDFTSMYLVFDLMESDLHAVLRSPQPLTDEHVRYFLYQILRGLKYIHSANVVHRDLKPGNLLVNQDCELKIGDFGMARTVACANDDFLHQTPLMTQYVATRWYRAPELLLFRRQYTVDVDMWSVGCIFAEMLARKAFFPGNDLMHQLMLIIGVLGPPDDDFIELAHSERVKDFLRKLEKKHPVSFKSVLPTAHPKALKLLEKMLQWNPCARISVEDSLKDLYLNAYHALDNEPICLSPLNFEIDEEKITAVDQLRDIMFNEIMAQHNNRPSSVPAYVPPESLTTNQSANGATKTVKPAEKPLASIAGRQPIGGAVVASSAASQSTATSSKSIATHPKPTRPVRRSRTNVTSQYRFIVPGVGKVIVEKDDKPVDAKAVLRAAILSGRRKEPVAKTSKGRAKKFVNDVLNQDKKQTSLFLNLTEEDKSMLVRWRKMQENSNRCQKVENATAANQFRTINHDITHTTVNVITNELSRSHLSTTNHDSDHTPYFSQQSSSQTPVVTEAKSNAGNLISDVRLVNQSPAQCSAMLWSPSEVLLATSTVEQSLSLERVSEKGRRNDAEALSRLPVMVALSSLDSLDSLPSLDYWPDEQFKDTLTLIDFIAGVDGVTRHPLADASAGLPKLSFLNDVNVPRLTSSPAEMVGTAMQGASATRVVGSDSVLFPDIEETTRPTSSSLVKDDVSWGSLIQTGSGSGYGVGLNIDSLLHAGDGIMDMTATPWLSGNVDFELDALIEQVFVD